MSVYQSVVAISKPYLGPATEQFICRQCKLLKIDAQQLQTSNLPMLAKWVEIGAALLMDPAKAKELGTKVKAL